MDRRRLELLLILPSIALTIYYLWRWQPLRAVVSAASAFFTLPALRLLRLRRRRRVDGRLVDAIVHMYALSMGQIGPDDLIKAIAETEEYGRYAEVFSRIRYLARDLGYGFTRATTLVAEGVEQPLRDVLIRCVSVFSSLDPEGYLEMEASTITEEFAGSYTRTLEALRVIGGVFNTFQSAIIFIIMTLSMLTVFMANPNVIYYAYALSAAAILAMLLGLKAISAKEPLIHIGEDPPRLYKAMKIGLIALMPASLIAIPTYLRWGPPALLLTLGGGIIIPGFLARRIEERVNKIDEHYPTFLKALGENMASTANMKLSLTYILDLELGPLRALIEKALNRIRLGISNRKALMMMASEAASHCVYIANKVFLDAVSYGGDPLKVGKVLGNHIIKFLEFRKRRQAIAKSFDGLTIIMQAMIVALLDLLIFLCGYFSGTMTSLPFFSFGEIPIGFIKLGNLAVALYLSILNAVAGRELSSGFWGTILWRMGVLLILSGAVWMGMDLLIEGVFSEMMPGFETLMPA